MSTQKLQRLLVTTTLCSVWLTAGVMAADWPQYRGPGRDGHSAETGLAKTWPAAGPKQLWKVALGEGYSGIVVAKNRAFTLFGKDQTELVIALDVATGKELWRQRVDKNRPDGMGGGPRATPTVDGDTVYALGANGKLVALEAATGKPVWSVDLVATYGAQIPQWGISCSPLVDGDLLLLDVGGRQDFSVVALDKKTGKLRWSSQTDKPGYSAPLIVTAAGVRQALFFTGTALVSVDPATGKLFWRVPWRTSYDVNAAMPVFIAPDKVFISSGYETGAGLFRISKTATGLAATEVWTAKHMKNHFNSSVLVGDHLYGFDNGTLKAIRVDSGAEAWSQRGFAKGSLLVADGLLVVLSEKGELALVKAVPDSYQELARTQIFEARTWTMPTLADGRLFVRSEGELVALDLKNP